MWHAQTNVQLYRQLTAADWAEDDLRHVQAAYRLALRVVAGHYDASERPFLTHLVGVASVLARDGADSTMVSAGLLHSVYEHGDFGDGSRGLSEPRRREVRRVVGSASEEIIARYAMIPWSESLLASWTPRAKHLAPVDSAVAWIKLADLLESAIGSGAAESLLWSTTAVRLAQQLGRPELGQRLAACNPSAERATMPTFLTPGRSRSFAMTPLSHAIRPGVRLLQMLRRLRETVASSPLLARRLATAPIEP